MQRISVWNVVINKNTISQIETIALLSMVPHLLMSFFLLSFYRDSPGLFLPSLLCFKVWCDRFYKEYSSSTYTLLAEKQFFFFTNIVIVWARSSWMITRIGCNFRLPYRRVSMGLTVSLQTAYNQTRTQFLPCKRVFSDKFSPERGFTHNFTWT